MLRPNHQGAPTSPIEYIVVQIAPAARAAHVDRCTIRPHGVWEEVEVVPREMLGRRRHRQKDLARIASGLQEGLATLLALVHMVAGIDPLEELVAQHLIQDCYPKICLVARQCIREENRRSAIEIPPEFVHRQVFRGDSGDRAHHSAGLGTSRALPLLCRRFALPMHPFRWRSLLCRCRRRAANGGNGVRRDSAKRARARRSRQSSGASSDESATSDAPRGCPERSGSDVCACQRRRPQMASGEFASQRAPRRGPRDCKARRNHTMNWNL
mmetsp:Transcript_126263/g.403564  ORF Transcript_126263/g.403564 Transcript_126263/m.403564 type:complete len:270 (+) Transcript_126263:1710-2519(+)